MFKPFRCKSTKWLQIQHFPHFISRETKVEVLRLYKEFVCEISKISEPLVRLYLRDYIYESFIAYKYVAKPQEIRNLIKEARKNLATIHASNNHDIKGTRLVLDFVVSNYLIKEPPLRQLHHRTHLEHSRLEYRIRNLTAPRVTTIRDHISHIDKRDSLFFEFWAFYHNNLGSKGKLLKKRALFTPKLSATVWGEDPPLCRQKNSLKQLYSQFLSASIKPIHHDLLVHIRDTVDQLRSGKTPLGFRKQKSRNSRRYFCRRFEELLTNYYSCKYDNGALTMITYPSQKFYYNELYLGSTPLPEAHTKMH